MSDRGVGVVGDGCLMLKSWNNSIGVGVGVGAEDEVLEQS